MSIYSTVFNGLEQIFSTSISQINITNSLEFATASIEIRKLYPLALIVFSSMSGAWIYNKFNSLDRQINELISEYNNFANNPQLRKKFNIKLEQFCNKQIEALKLRAPWNKPVQQRILTSKVREILTASHSSNSDKKETLKQLLVKYSNVLTQLSDVCAKDFSLKKGLCEINRLFSTLSANTTSHQEMNNIQQEVSSIIKTFCSMHWNEMNLPTYFDNPKNHNYLSNKISKILLSKDQSNTLRMEILENALNNLKDFIFEFSTRFEKDKITETFTQIFQTQPNDEIVKIFFLGEETHLQGKTPLKIALKNPQNDLENLIIYKPRSMLAEQVICGTTQSLFSQVGEKLATFHILNKNDYGYCEFIQNNNYINNEEELEQYAMQFFLLDAFARELGIADLHSQNIISRYLSAFLIDLEVVMLPTDKTAYDSQLLDGLQAGWIFDKETKNQVQGYGKNEDSHHCMTALTEKIRKIKNDPNKQAQIQSSLTKNRSYIEECKQRLLVAKHRFVSISTGDLCAEIRLNPECAFAEFKEYLIQAIHQRWEGILIEDQLPVIKELFLKDLRNNDVPVFYFDPQKRTVYYYDAIIAKL